MHGPLINRKSVRILLTSMSVAFFWLFFHLTGGWENSWSITVSLENFKCYLIFKFMWTDERNKKIETHSRRTKKFMFSLTLSPGQFLSIIKLRFRNEMCKLCDILICLFFFTTQRSNARAPTSPFDPYLKTEHIPGIKKNLWSEICWIIFIKSKGINLMDSTICLWCVQPKNIRWLIICDNNLSAKVNFMLVSETQSQHCNHHTIVGM